MKYFNANNWQGLTGIAISILGIVISVWMTLALQGKKSISYDILSNIDIGKSVHPGMKIIYKDKIIDDGAILNAMIKNDGNQPVIAKDYDGPIEIVFSDKSSVKDSFILKKSPSNIKTEVSFSNNIVKLSPSLLNPGDFIVLQVLVESDKQPPSARARIAGIDKITSVNERREKFIKWVGYGLWIYCIFALAIFSLMLKGILFKKNRCNGNVQLSISGAILTGFLVLMPAEALFLMYSEKFYTLHGWRLLVTGFLLMFFGGILSIFFDANRPSE